MSTWLHVLVFVVASAAIWWAGTRLERYADELSERTGLGHAFTGVLLLAMATSLPELATTVTAVVWLDNPTLAVHTLLGGVAFQTALLVIGDRAMPRKGALTFFSPQFALLIQGVGLLVLLQLVIAGTTAGGAPAVASVSVWLVAVPATYVGVMYLTYRHRDHARWTPVDHEESANGPGQGGQASPSSSGGSLRGVVLKFVGASLVVLAAGWFATHSADSLAERTGLGSAFLGATLLAAATSLPELSTTISAVRRGRNTLAISNVFGSNAFDVSLLLVADIGYRQGTVLARAEPSAVFVAAIGAVMTSIYLWGLMERENRTILGVGWDSFAALTIYLVAMAVLYSMT
jgi:cation:H+ antiporter